MRKFTKFIKEVFEYEITQEVNQDEADAMGTLSKVASNKHAASSLGTKTL